MHDQQLNIYRKMSMGCKLELAAEFNRSARELKAATLRSVHPEWTEQQIRRKVKETFLYAPS
ncbi:MAG: hypothetical protein ACOCUY_03925 [Verrucomicrobiota bacterium]